MRFDILIAIILSIALHATFAYGDKIIALIYTPKPPVQVEQAEELVIAVRVMPPDLIEPPPPDENQNDTQQENVTSFVPPMAIDMPSPTIDNAPTQQMQITPMDISNAMDVAIIPEGPIVGIKDQIKMFDLKDLDRQPSTRYAAQPAYPFEAKREGLSGTVLLEFAISDKGEVISPQVVSSTDRRFEEAALNAIMRSTFTPGRTDGKAVYTRRVQVPVKFDIENAD